MKKNISGELKHRIIKALELPKEIILDLPHISLIGNEEVTVENYKSIIEYKSDVLRLNTSAGILRIEGKSLCLRQITSDQIRITGSIMNIQYGGY